MKNEEAFQKLGIYKWHNAGVTGKGVKVAILGFEAGAHHNGASIIKEVAPECEVIEYDVMRGVDWSFALEDCIRQNVDVICCSLRKYSWATHYEELSRQLYEKGVIMLDSADNENCIIDAWPAKSQYWYAIGAYDDGGKASYSNYGKKLSFLSYTNLYAENSKGSMIPISHTSGAVQAPAGMVALLKQVRKIGPKEFDGLLKESCVDLKEAGKDIETGWGLFVMPDMKEIVLEIGSNIYEVDGVKKFSDVSPFISDSRTFVPVRIIAEALGCLVAWDEKEKKVYIRR